MKKWKKTGKWASHYQYSIKGITRTVALLKGYKDCLRYNIKIEQITEKTLRRQAEPTLLEVLSGFMDVEVPTIVYYSIIYYEEMLSRLKTAYLALWKWREHLTNSLELKYWNICIKGNVDNKLIRVLCACIKKPETVISTSMKNSKYIKKWGMTRR